jgi:TM2 domain-containing membrane protein YozV
VLALLLGGLGLHKFYLNKPGQGVFYLLFCWTFIPAVIGLIEGLSYLFMNDEAFQRRFVNGAAQKPVDKRPIWIVWVAIIITALIVIFFN